MTEAVKSARWVFDSFAWKANYNQMFLALSAIQIEERDRIDKFVFLKDAKRSLIGRLLMRRYICQASGIDWAKLNLKRDSFGKPYLENPNILLQFNVSHSGHYVVLAGEVGDLKLGIDVMKMEYTGGRSISEFFRIMDRNFSSEEWSTIKESKDEDIQINMFYRFWCLKESYVKAIGKGITVDLQKINFQIKTKSLEKNVFVKDTQVLVNGIREDNWVFEETLLDEGHCCCVALHANKNHSKNTSKFNYVTFENIQEDCKSINVTDPIFCRQFLNKE